ncbi:MAG: YegS/Rv2252/BmrU family lipid kinase [Cyanobacteria bacterium P01_D01_bin.36]
MFQNVYLIFNPVSGQGNADRELAIIQEVIASATRLSILKTTTDIPARQLADQAVKAGADCVIASGGDGTVSTVAGALIDTDICLGIVPRGTANAITAAFGINTDIRSACHTVLSGIPRQVDMASCNGQPLMLLAGVGLEADVISQANRQLKNRVGSAAYILSAFREVRELSTFRVELETPDRIIAVDASGITVANVAPATSVLAQGPSDVLPYDGLLDVTIFAPEGTGGAIAASYSLFQSALNKRSSKREDVGYFRTASVKITADPAQKVVLDGEITGETPIEIHCVEKGITLMTPKDGGNFDPLEKLDGLPNLEIHYKS